MHIRCMVNQTSLGMAFCRIRWALCWADRILSSCLGKVIARQIFGCSRCLVCLVILRFVNGLDFLHMGFGCSVLLFFFRDSDCVVRAIRFTRIGVGRSPLASKSRAEGSGWTMSRSTASSILNFLVLLDFRCLAN